MIDREKARYLIGILLFTNVILFAAWIATLSIAVYTKNQLVECHQLLKKHLEAADE